MTGLRVYMFYLILEILEIIRQDKTFFYFAQFDLNVQIVCRKRLHGQCLKTDTRLRSH